MPAGSPFTRLCQQLAAVRRDRADLHIHTIHSDGTFSPAEVVARARGAGLFAIAVTDHDSLGSWQELCIAAKQEGPPLEVITGVEITTEYDGRELHLLGYDVSPDDHPLNLALSRLREQRRDRFREMAGQLAAWGVPLSRARVDELARKNCTLGRRHLASLLIEMGHAPSRSEAFRRYLSRPELVGTARHRLPIAEALELVRQAGGVSSWAHPSLDVTIVQLSALREMGLRAVECEYPWTKASHGRKLREMANVLGLAISGGSDCHGPDHAHAIGSRGISRSELDLLLGRSKVNKERSLSR